jgi:hypothetical protein
MTEENVPLTDDFLDAAHELREITMERKRLDAREKTCKEIISKHLVEGQTGFDPESGEALVRVAHGAMVWNEEQARKNLPASMLASLTDVVTVEIVDKGKAQEILPPALYALCCKQSKPSVRAL